MIAALLALPVLAGILAALLRGHRTLLRVILLAAATGHAGLTATAFVVLPPPLASGWVALDETGLLFLSLVSAVFLASAWYTIGYLKRRRESDDAAGEGRFVACMLAFLATMTLATLSQQFELLWIAIEATTLASAPLIYFHRSRHAMEATWKYVVLCSVGIALALLGTVFLGLAADRNGHPSLSFDSLVSTAAGLDPALVRTAFVFLIVGYGTKMGLAPLHAWLPDAHSEAPSPVSALLSGASLNLAFLAILRVLPICEAAGEGAFARQLLIMFGLVSLLLAAVFVLRQPDFKRLLAYSSVEHMGFAALGVGLGGAAVGGALLHVIGHSLVKGMLFLAAGNILSAWHTRRIDQVSGMARVLPGTATLWMSGLFLITGLPPSILFVSEWTILRSAVSDGRWGVVTIALVLLSVVFVGMLSAFLKMILGSATEHPVRPGDDGRDRRETAWLLAPPFVLGIAAVLLGLLLPTALSRVIVAVAAQVGGNG